MSAYELRAADLAAGALEVWTEKEGLLSRVAHDLCLSAREASLRLAPGEGGWELELRVPVRALFVRGQVRRGEVSPLSAKEHAEIETNLRGPKVLDAARYPEIVYRGRCRLEGERAEVEGELELRGRRVPLPLRASWQAGAGEARTAGEVGFLQSAWGIKPFSAMLGALKLKDPLRVSWDLRLAEAAD